MNLIQRLLRPFRHTRFHTSQRVIEYAPAPGSLSHGTRRRSHCVLAEVSRKGLQIVTLRPADVGEQYLVYLTSNLCPDVSLDHAEYRLRVEVRWSKREEGHRLFRCGMQCIEPPAFPSDLFRGIRLTLVE
ncbi:MAG: PilZ domain-containing protein [Planctomycetes bacterium]|nr:PilZ domain-containing protein [Planctomycetota bacterium]